MTPIFTHLLLDYGHGGIIDGVYQTPGGKQYTHTSVSPPLVLYEGVSNRRTAWRLLRRALAAGVPVFDVVAARRYAPGVDAPPATWHDLEQLDVSLSRRTRAANKYRGGLYVSVHSNAIGNTISGPSRSARGVDVYTSHGQTAADPVADTLHAAFQEVLAGEDMPVRRGDWRDDDADHEAGFWVLRKTAMAAVLGEVGFFTNIDDARFLDSERGQDLIAEAYWRGVGGWLRPIAGWRAAC
jgi:N-acetylmuramoyl-L-alanine amidase